ncbi:hypothetical protein [Mesorhizobium sp. NPDC059025]|uniref:hypothetical protein n=1 Tax=unclassified Mesorhizobium TaxID=325217 RepID=UPI0036C12033
MDRTEITSSRMKAFTLSVVGLGFVLCGIVGRERIGEEWFWLGQIFFGLCSLTFLWVVIRPHKLLLDDEGVTLSGGLHWSPRSVPWRNIEEFVTKSGLRGTTLIGIRFRSGAKHEGLARWVGANDVIPGGWRQSNEEMVSYLNVCRIIAMNRTAKST